MHQQVKENIELIRKIQNQLHTLSLASCGFILPLLLLYRIHFSKNQKKMAKSLDTKHFNNDIHQQNVAEMATVCQNEILVFQIIFSREYTQAEGRSWHVQHFCCWFCDTALAGQRYIAKENNPYCVNCFDKLLSKVSVICCSVFLCFFHCLFQCLFSLFLMISVAVITF